MELRDPMPRQAPADSARKISVLNFGKYFPPVSGGIEVHTKLLAEFLSGRYDLTVLVHSADTRTTVEAMDGYQVIRMATQFKISTQPFSFGMIGHLLKTRYDVIHLHAPNLWASTLTGILRGKAKLVITHHADILGRGMLGALVVQLYRRVARKADLLLLMSMNTFESSVDLAGVAAKIRVVPHAVEPGLFPASPGELLKAAEIRARLAGSRPTLVFAGRLVPYKGLDVLVRAAPRLGDLRVLVIGTGPERASLEAQALALGVSEKFVFLGNVPESDKNATLRAGDVFVFPSTTAAEAFGIAQVEAQLCGLPVVTSLLPTGVTDVTRDGVTGLCVPPQDADALARAINRLMADAPLRQKFGNAGLARAHANYVPEAVRRKLLAAYDELLASTAG